MSGAEEKITAQDIVTCWGSYANEYFADLLNGDCTLESTISDLRSLIGSKWDVRCAANTMEQNGHVTQQIK